MERGWTRTSRPVSREDPPVPSIMEYVAVNSSTFASGTDQATPGTRDFNSRCVEATAAAAVAARQRSAKKAE